MTDSAAQSTDAENSRSLYKAKNAGDDLKQLSKRSAQDIAKDDGGSTGGSGNGEVVTAPIPGNA